MTKKQALNYLKSSGFSKEQIQAIVGALTNSEKPNNSTTKNDLEVDCISRAQTQTEIEMNASRYTIAKERGGMGQVEWSDQLIKVSDAVDIIRNMPSVTPQPRKGHWPEEFNDLEGEVRFTCSCCGKYQLFGTDFCYNCGAKMEEVKE